MSEIKIGDYVRTRGIIGKLIRIEFDKIDISLKWYVLDINESQETFVNKPYIEKYSKNIIDLIEVGDVIKYKELRYFSNYETNFNEEYLIGIRNANELKNMKKEAKNNKIKVIQIYTKEQLKSIKYEVKGE